MKKTQQPPLNHTMILGAVILGVGVIIGSIVAGLSIATALPKSIILTPVLSDNSTFDNTSGIPSNCRNADCERSVPTTRP